LGEKRECETISHLVNDVGSWWFSLLWAEVYARKCNIRTSDW
jgi:hypothetical protein